MGYCRLFQKSEGLRQCAGLAINPTLTAIGAFQLSRIKLALLAVIAQAVDNLKITDESAPAVTVLLPVLRTVQALLLKSGACGVDFFNTALFEFADEVKRVFCHAAIPCATRFYRLVINRLLKVLYLDVHGLIPFVVEVMESWIGAYHIHAIKTMNANENAHRATKPPTIAHTPFTRSNAVGRFTSIPKAVLNFIFWSPFGGFDFCVYYTILRGWLSTGVDKLWAGIHGIAELAATGDI